MNRKIYSFSSAFFMIALQTLTAQTPLSSAILDLTLQCVGGSETRTSVAYNPNQQLYYSVNGGLTTYPIETYDVTGSPLFSSASGFDYRGIWWNSNTNLLEGNGYSTSGIWIPDMNANFYALGTGTNDITPASGPNLQSTGSYDPVSNYIIYYDAGLIHRYDGSNHTLVSSSPITGLPVAASNLNSYAIAYTGVIGMEYGVYDYVNRAFYFINKSSGAYVMTCQLPGTAPGPQEYRFSFANGYVWLYNDGTSQWEGYRAVDNCEAVVVNLTETYCDSYTVPSGDETYMTSGMYSDTIPSANGCDSILMIDLTINSSTFSEDIQEACGSYTWIDGFTYTESTATSIYILPSSNGCDSTILLNLTITDVDVSASVDGLTITSSNASASFYQWINCSDNSPIAGETNASFTATENGEYAVIITEGDCSDTSECFIIDNVSIKDIGDAELVEVYPNPATTNITVDLGEYTTTTIELLNNLGQVVSTFDVNNQKQFNINTTDFARGVYFVNIQKENSRVVKRIVLSK